MKTNIKEKIIITAITAVAVMIITVVLIIIPVLGFLVIIFSHLLDFGADLAYKLLN